jgi:hypothetical protein
MTAADEDRTSHRVTTVFYGVVVAIAGLGNATASWGEPPALIPPGLWLGIKGIAAAALELGGVVLAINADVRRRKGEKAVAWRFASAAIAVLAIAINLVGHANEVIFAGIFTGFSALGYAVYLIKSGDRRRDQLRAEGKLPPTAPSYGLGQWLAEPALTRRAKQLALEDPTLGLYGSLASAREEGRQKAGRAALREALAAQLGATTDESHRPVALATYDLDKIVSHMRAAADNVGIADALGAQLTVHRVIGRNAPRPRVDGAHHDAHTRAPRSAPQRGAQRATDARQRRAERATTGWWNASRERVYAQYARRLDAGQGEMTADEMRTDLGVTSGGGARNVRDTKMRTRYAREVVDGARAPRDGAQLPNAIAGLIAAHRARELGPELRVMSAPNDASESAS